MRPLRALTAAVFAAALLAAPLTSAPRFAIARSHTSTNSDYSGTSTATPTSGTVALGTGSLAYGCLRYFGATSVSTISDTAGNSYTVATTRAAGGGETLVSFYKENAASYASNVVTVTMGSAVQYWSVDTVEYTGINTSSSYDQTAQNDAASGGTVTSSSFTTTANDEVLVACSQVSAAGATWTADTGYTSAVQDASTVTMVQDKIVSSIQTSATTTATSSNTGSPMIILVDTFKGSGSGAASPGAIINTPVRGGGGWFWFVRLLVNGLV